MKLEKKFIDQRFCQKNGFSENQSIADFIKNNKKYYQDLENYDWVRVVDGFFGLEAILHRSRERKIISLVKKYGRAGEYLDAGCGTGLILRHLPAGSVGLDINPRNIVKAKMHAPKAKLVLGDIEKIPLPKLSFNTVICSDVLEHLIQPQKALKEIFRILKPGGVLIGSVPRQNLIWNFRFLSSTHPGEPYHKLYQKQELTRLLKGKKILRLETGCQGMNYFFVVAND